MTPDPAPQVGAKGTPGSLAFIKILEREKAKEREPDLVKVSTQALISFAYYAKVYEYTSSF